MQRVGQTSALVVELDEEELDAQILSLAELELQLDADTGQYYHLDKKTNTKIWYSPPP